MNIAFEQRPDFYSDLDPALPSDVYDSNNDGKLTFTRLVYDQASVVALIKPKEATSKSSEEGFFSSLGEMYSDYPFGMSFMTLMLIVALIGTGYSFRKSEGDLILTNDNPENEILEAEIV